MMSHELRTPLHVVLGYADLLLENTFGEMSAAQIDVLKRLQRSGKLLLERVSHILDLRRLEDGRFPLQVTVVQLLGLLRHIEEELPELRQQSDIRYSHTIDEGLPTIRTDPGKLTMILRNLLSNALKFTEVGMISLEVSRHNTGIEISLADTGIGIPASATSDIFEPFYQVDSPDMRRRGGVGLGLHIVKRLVGLLDGSVTAESVLGQGSTFRVWLPEDYLPDGHENPGH